jgi:methylenetetrahydrofolate reductase (NADPH)
MNLEASCVKAIKGLGIMNSQKELPFTNVTAVQDVRTKEEVRPIFWANKPQSYCCRTNNWDEYPNGRWGNSKSAAFDYEEEHYHYLKKYVSTNIKEKLKAWGTQCRTLNDISKVFINFLTGKIKKFPFSE